MKIPLPGKKVLPYLLHGFTWGAIILLTTYFFISGNRSDTNALWHNYRNLILYAVIFYFNYLVIIPKLFFGNHKLWYFTAALTLIIILTLTLNFSFRRQPPRPDFNPGFNQEQPMRPVPRIQSQRQGMPPSEWPRPPMNLPVYNFFITALLITGISLGLRFSDRYIEQEKQHKEVEREQLNTELAFLKNQINPHFFFNTLNNIYSLVQTNVNDGQKAILQLSKLMRYLLYETDKEIVPISREIDFMKIYIELMRLRLTPKIDLEVSFPETYPDVNISPLLFLPFIENAFKHGISNRTLSFIHIEMDVRQDEISFHSTNSLTVNNSKLGEESGIGLENVRKRLRLLYPNNHELKISKEDSAFNVLLNIHLESTPVND